MKVENNKFYVVSLGQEKIIEQTRKEAIDTIKQLVSESEGDVADLNPEIIEVDTSGEKWSLKGLSWNQIALELMRGK